MHKPRVVFFPGFAEDIRVFEQMLPHFATDFHYVVVDYQDILLEIDEKKPDLPLFARLIAEKYDIQDRDLLIGHSFGGWAAINVQLHTSSPVVSIGSFTHPKKPKVSKIGFNRLGYWLIKKGMFKSPLLHAITRFRYKNTPMWGAVAPCIEVMKTYKDLDLLKITKLIAHQNPVTPIAPLLHIHAPKDQTVSPPDEPHIVVHGDHFIQHTHAEELSKYIKDWKGSL